MDEPRMLHGSQATLSAGSTVFVAFVKDHPHGPTFAIKFFRPKPEIAGRTCISTEEDGGTVTRLELSEEAAWGLLAALQRELSKGDEEAAERKA